MRRTAPLIVASACFAATLTACSTGTDSASSSDTSTTPSIVTPVDVAETATETAAATTTAVAPPASVETTTPAPAQTAIMPDVVCMNLQAAQNRIQEEGVFYSRSEDASGEGRSQLIDRNWVVVAQTPSAGTEFGEGDAVLSAVKIGEPGSC